MEFVPLYKIAIPAENDSFLKNYTNRATTACDEVSANFLRIEGATWSV
jgi:hypothetical protein